MMYASNNTASVALAVASWLVAHAPSARGFDAATLARAALIVSLNAHACTHGAGAAATDVSTLFELGSKFAHSCDPNAFYDWCAATGEMTHKTLRAVAPGEALTVDYYATGVVESTPVRRHRLARGKFFVCGCAVCAAPDALASLPCPACVPRDAEGCVPLERVFVAPADARDWEHPSFIGLREHPVAIPDDGANPVEEGTAAAAAAPAVAPAWRCATCGGAFSRRAMARLLIPAGVRRPLPRTEMMSARFGAARLLDVARWAESGAISGRLNLQHLLTGPDAVLFAPGGVAEEQAIVLCTFMNEIAPIVGTSHASVISLRLFRLRTALHGAYALGCDPAQPRPRDQVARDVRRLLGVRAGTAAAATPASALLAAEVTALAAALRRAKRLAALAPETLCHLACVMDALGGLEDQNIARCGCCVCGIASHACLPDVCPAFPAALPTGTDSVCSCLRVCVRARDAWQAAAGPAARCHAWHSGRLGRGGAADDDAGHVAGARALLDARRRRRRRLCCRVRTRHVAKNVEMHACLVLRLLFRFNPCCRLRSAACIRIAQQLTPGR
jgi:hypothetical protein